MTTKHHCLTLLVALLCSQSIAEPVTPPRAAALTNKQVCLPATASDTAASWTEGQKQLGAGIAAFDEGQLTVASERIKRALRSGLDVPLERAAANKYLGLVYCANRAGALCRKHFEAAIAASAEITFDDIELRTSLYRQSLIEAQKEHARKGANQESKTGQRDRALDNDASARSGKSKTTETGTVRLDIRPWAQVLVNNRPLAITPPSKSLTLAAGQYSLELRNPAGPPLRAEVIVPVGGSIDLAHRF
jgi:hypothetical protein